MRTRYLVPVVPLLVVGTALPASAAVSVTGNQVNGDGADDNIFVSCTGGLLAAGGDTGDPCVTLESLGVYPGEGSDAVSLAGMTAADFPSLTQVTVSVDEFGISAVDTVIGSPFDDAIYGDGSDTANGGAGDDVIDGAGTAVGGAGDDVVLAASDSASGGPGDDRFLQFTATGGIDGGPGHDTWEADFDQVPTGISGLLELRLTADELQVRAGAVSQAVSISGLEHAELVLLRGEEQLFDGSVFPGTLNVRGVSGVDTILGSAFDDHLHGGSGNDALTGGAGVDTLQAGVGDDTVQARDGLADRVDCGDGTDTVVADAVDVVAGCESVQLPPVVTPPPAPVTPDTGKVTGKKKVTAPKKARFRFSSPTPGVTFQCRLDGKKWKTCDSPHKVATKKLKRGKHTLRVRAVLAGVVDPTPSKRKFKVR